MKKCLVIPDSFKGTMTSVEVCDIMRERILSCFPGCEVVTIPIADGGEGTVDCFLHAFGGEKVRLRVKGPCWEELDAFYGITGKTAVIEIASVVGISHAGKGFDVGKATTYGVGQLVLDAVHRGCGEIIIGLGGSCTNDGGAGAAAALGTRFYDETGETFVPTGWNLGRIAGIDVSQTREMLKDCTVTAICDVDNPLYGETGAAYVFGGQKGADGTAIRELDGQLRLFAKAIQKSLGADVSKNSGGGAAGGMGAGAAVFFHAAVKKGIDMALDISRFESRAKNCDVIFTGEGKIDSQSLRGKVVIGVARRAKKLGIPVVAVVGDVSDDIRPVYECGVSAVFSTNRRAIPFEEEKGRCREDLFATMDDIMRFAKTVEQYSAPSAVCAGR